MPLNVINKPNQLNPTDKTLLPDGTPLPKRSIIPSGLDRGVASMAEDEQVLISHMLATLNYAQRAGLKLSLDELRPHIQNISNQDLGHVFFDMLSKISQQETIEHHYAKGG